MRVGLSETFEAKKAPIPEGQDQVDKWENVNDHYEKFSSFLSSLFELNSGFVSTVTLYIQTFGCFKLKQTLLPSICQSSSHILREISSFNTLMKAHSEKVTSFNSGAEKDRLKVFLDQFSRSLCWFVGNTAYKLIRISKDEKENPEKKEGKESENKMQDLIIQSNLLSGGIENRFLNLFSSEAQEQLRDIIKISEDKKMLELLNSKEKQNDDDDLF